MYTSPYATYLHPHSATSQHSKLKMLSDDLVLRSSSPLLELPLRSLSEDLDWKPKYTLIKWLKMMPLDDQELKLILLIKLPLKEDLAFTKSWNKKKIYDQLLWEDQDFKQISKRKKLRNQLLTKEPDWKLKSLPKKLHELKPNEG